MFLYRKKAEQTDAQIEGFSNTNAFKNRKNFTGWKISVGKQFILYISKDTFSGFYFTLIILICIILVIYILS